MNFGFSEEQDTIRETLARMLGDHATLKSAHNRLDGADGFDTATWSVLADGGWLGLAISEAEGGAGMGAVELAILAEEIGRSLAAVPYLPALCMAVPALQSTGTQDQRTSLLPGIAKGRTIIATALAEGGGLAPDTVSAKVVQDRLSGQKAPVTFGAEGTHALVAATDEEGTPRLYLADLSGSGVTIGALDPIDRTRPRTCSPKLNWRGPMPSSVPGRWRAVTVDCPKRPQSRASPLSMPCNSPLRNRSSCTAVSDSHGRPTRICSCGVAGS